MTVIDSIEGGLDEIFTSGSRRLFVERCVEHGIYRLYVSRPFGVLRRDALKWRIQITVQFSGQTLEHPVNDGRVTAPLVGLAAVVDEAAQWMDEHIKVNAAVLGRSRRETMRQVANSSAIEAS